ncbi:nucleoside hydrolase [Oculatella sp. LEGE 06141]|uniref:nucleoside hydrolase n=1 Tax=Oculatella sp. LEGE 06141 TaxID=1828648 RepID=UPI00187FDB95|nr:nucleoside hydrolase [Oculatella sp. LEGE 06141]MBE9181383.1 nucleoside hydrolase [Oculatella sp. LEGE 06141]
MTQSIIIDCDPGVDDAIALLLAFASPDLKVLGITTVAGNVPLTLTQANARRICELAGQTTVPVYAGCPRPIMRSLTTAEDIHGKTGLEGVELPEPTMPLQPQHGVDFLIETLMNSAGDIILATLGPLTNIAIALIKEPRIAAKISKLVLMGGSTTEGNVTPSAEFNIYVDPHAAHVVFTSGIQITMIGLNVTHQVLTTAARRERIRAIATPVSQVAADLLSRYGTQEVERGMAGSPLHDPCVIAYLLQPDLFTGHPVFVEVETGSELTMGRTVVDAWRRGDRPPNANVIQTVDANGFYDLLTTRLARL